MDANVKGRRPRRGFTLIEMLAVIVIIGILASLITVAALSAIKAAKNARIKLEIDQFDMSLTAYKTQFKGGYPPEDFNGAANEQAVERHLRQIFPRYDARNWKQDLNSALGASGLSYANIAPSNALVFWLGGIPQRRDGSDGKVGWVLTGFNADPRRPFALGGSRTKVLFEFDSKRLALDENGGLAYYPDAGVEAGPDACPYYYFRARDTYRYSHALSYNLGQEKGHPGPYYDVRSSEWVNKDSYQMVCAGLDNHFGRGSAYPTGKKPSGMGQQGPKSYTKESFDNITSFSNGTLENDIP